MDWIVLGKDIDWIVLGKDLDWIGLGLRIKNRSRIWSKGRWTGGPSLVLAGALNLNGFGLDSFGKDLDWIVFEDQK